MQLQEQQQRVKQRKKNSRNIMGAKKVHPIVAVTGVLIEDKEDVSRSAIYTHIQDQERSASSSVGLSLIVESLDRLIWAYSNLCHKKQNGIVDVNQDLEGIVKVLDMCSRVEDRLAEDVRAYQACLASAVRDSSYACASPTILAASSKSLASAASYQVGSCINLRLDDEVSSDASCLTDVMQQSYQFLESLSRCLTITVCPSKMTSSLRRAIDKVMKKKKNSREICGIKELKRVDALVKMLSAEEKEEMKMALASDLKKACQDLNDGISNIHHKINLLHSSLVKTRVALLDFLTYPW